MISDVVFHTVEVSDPAFEHEGLRSVTVRSAALGCRADVSVWVPEAKQISTLLILLHGVYGSHWAWPLKAGAHRTAERLVSSGAIAPLVIAMPSDGLLGDGSGYLTYPNAENVEQWIVEEVPAIARLAAPALQSDARVAIAGLSMGGFGALRLGAKYAERFAAISAHSAITDIAQMQEFVEEPIDKYLACSSREELSAFYWLRHHRERLPKLRFDCGVDDPLIEANRQFHAALEQEGIVHEYSEYEGSHDWPYWQQHIEQTLRFVSEENTQR